MSAESTIPEMRKAVHHDAAPGLEVLRKYLNLQSAKELETSKRL